MNVDQLRPVGTEFWHEFPVMYDTRSVDFYKVHLLKCTEPLTILQKLREML
jgi:hypothetical protein